MSENNLYGFGYEGKTAAELIETLKNYGISTLVDIRLTPISRKKGLSKTKLKEAIEANSMKYVHLPALGNPKDNRAGFSTPDSEAWRDARDKFESLLGSDAAQNALTEVHDLMQTGTVGLLCFEANARCCHRDVVINHITSGLSRTYQAA